MYKIRFGYVEATELSTFAIVYNQNYSRYKTSFLDRIVCLRPVKPGGGLYMKKNQEGNFYTKLENSILKEGIRNPIFVQAVNTGSFCRYGTSRLWIGQKHKLKIPAVIADYGNYWSDLEELFNVEQIREKYLDQPEIVTIDQQMMRIDKCEHSHLKLPS